MNNNDVMKIEIFLGTFFNDQDGQIMGWGV